MASRPLPLPAWGMPMVRMLVSLRNIRLVRYLGASVIALAADIGTFLLLLQASVMPVLASAAAYGIGILVHWLISSRTVFQDSVARKGFARTKQKAAFVVSALLGLGLTTLIVGGGDLLGLDPRLAKLVAIGASFTLTWILRNAIIFRKGAAV